MAAKHVKGSKLLTFEEVKASKGAGWTEIWYEADEEEGDPERIELVECAWCAGNVVYADESVTFVNDLEKHYNKQYGERIWTGSRKPTEARRASTPWNG